MKKLVTEAEKEQLAELTYAARFMHQGILDAKKKIAEILDEPYDEKNLSRPAKNISKVIDEKGDIHKLFHRLMLRVRGDDPFSFWQTVGVDEEFHTPKYIFDILDTRFDLDVCAPVYGPMHVPCDDWYTKGRDGPWKGFIWMCPPKDNKEWLEKFIAHGNGIALLPCFTNTIWWQRMARASDVISFIHGDVKFIRQKPYKYGEVAQSLFGIGEKAVQVLSEIPKHFALTTIKVPNHV